MTIDKFKTIAKSAKAVIFDNDAYMFDAEYEDDNKQSFVICGHRDEDTIIIPYADIKSIRYSRKTKEYTIFWYDTEYCEYWELAVKFLIVKWYNGYQKSNT